MAKFNHIGLRSRELPLAGGKREVVEGKSETLESGKGLILPCVRGPFEKHEEASKEPPVLKFSRGPGHAHPDF